MTKATVVHIGLVKAASSTLQEHLFARHSGLHHLGTPWTSEPLSLAFNELTSAEVYDFDLRNCRDLCTVELERAAAANKVPSVSAEAFSICERANRVMIAERIHAACGPAKIVVVLRNQLDWLASRYVHNYLKPIPETRLRFNDWLFSHWRRDTFSYRHHADYDTLLRVYEEVFGPENVYVLLLEALHGDREKFVGDLCSTMGVDPVEGVGLMEAKHDEKRGSRLGYMRRRLDILPNVAFSKILPAPLHTLATKLVGGKMEPKYSDAWRSDIEDYYRAGNVRIAQRYGLPLAEHGYPV